MNGHLSEADLARYLEGREEVRDLDAHLKACLPCMKWVQEEAKLEIALGEIARATPTCPGCGGFSETDRCQGCGAARCAGDFEVERIITANTHGRVYLARAADNSLVALKELVFVQAPSFKMIDAFQREAQYLRTLCHPSIPKFKASFTVGEGVHTRLYLAQEYIQGQSLRAAMKEHRFNEAEIRSVAQMVLSVLAYLQSTNPMVIHRDIKPDNLIRRNDGSIAVVDFGAARDTATDRASSSTGTFGYMPVEQHAGVLNKTTDVYALGMSLIHLLTRREPWDYQQNRTALDKVELNSKTRAWLYKATAPRIEDRFENAQIARRALDKKGRRPKPNRKTMLLWAAVLAIGAIGFGLGLSYKNASSSRQIREAGRPTDRTPVFDSRSDDSSLTRPRDLFRFSPKRPIRKHTTQGPIFALAIEYTRSRKTSLLRQIASLAGGHEKASGRGLRKKSAPNLRRPQAVR